MPDSGGSHYGLCGGLAVAVHGYPRFTKDIDILIRPELLEVANRASRKSNMTWKVGYFGLTLGQATKI